MLAAVLRGGSAAGPSSSASVLQLSAAAFRTCLAAQRNIGGENRIGGVQEKELWIPKVDKN